MDPKIALLDRIFANPALWGFLGVLAGGGITWFIEWRKDVTERERALAYACALCSSEIYRFVSRCSDVAADSGRHDAEGTLEVSTDQPDLSFAELDIDWRSFPPHLADRILSLPNALRDVKHRLADIAEFTDRGDEGSYIFERQLAYTNLGLLAERLRDDVRAAGELKLEAPSKSAAFLAQQLKDLLADKAETEARIAKWNAEHPTPPVPLPE